MAMTAPGMSVASRDGHVGAWTMRPHHRLDAVRNQVPGLQAERPGTQYPQQECV